jgi:hypothetical protein
MPDIKETAAIFASVNWAQVAAAVFASFFSHSLSVRLGSVTLTATVNGAPVHLTPDALVAAAFLAFAGQAASIQVGSILVTATPIAAIPTPVSAA